MRMMPRWVFWVFDGVRMCEWVDVCRFDVVLWQHIATQAHTGEEKGGEKGGQERGEEGRQGMFD